MSLAKRLREEKTHQFLEKHLKEEALHQNLQEHRMNPLQFIVRLTVFALLGIVLGGLINWAFENIQDSCTNRWTTRGQTVLQIVLLSVIVYIASLLIGASVDDWVMATWSGFLFALTFFASQKSLNRNIECSIGK